MNALSKSERADQKSIGLLIKTGMFYSSTQHLCTFITRSHVRLTYFCISL